mgnify:CR=1 FL=1
MRKVTCPSHVRQEVFQRAMIRGHCECDIDSHDHGLDECHRKPKYLILKHHGLQFAPDSWMIVCSYCRTQIRLEHG